MSDYSLQAEIEIWDDITRPSDAEEDEVLVTCPYCAVEHRVYAEVEDLSCDDCYQERRELRRERDEEAWRDEAPEPDEDDLPW